MSTAPSIALCGAGMIARVHGAAALRIGATVSAIASRDPRNAIRLTEELGGRAVLVEELPDGADVLVVCTPPAHHEDPVSLAVSGGTSVLVEKPLCTTLEAADRMVDLAGSGTVLYAENLLHAPVVETLLAAAPSLGLPTHVEVRTLQGLPTWGEFTTEAWGGGALFDLGSHPLSLALQIGEVCGQGDPVAVTAEMRGGPTHRSDEHADVFVEFAGGLRAHVVASWQAGPAPVWDIQVASASGVLRAEVLPVCSVERNGEPLPLPAPTVEGPLGDLGYAAQLRRALGLDPTGERPNVDLGRRVLDVTCGAYASAASGGARVALPYSGRRDVTPLQILRA